LGDAIEAASMAALLGYFVEFDALRI
jgi:hypothetical protein